MKATLGIASLLRCARTSGVYFAAGAGLLLAAGQAMPQVGSTAPPAAREPNQANQPQAIVGAASGTTTLDTGAGKPRVSLRAVLGIRLATDESGPAVLQVVAPNSIADRVGLRIGDQVLSVNGARVKSTTDFVAMLHKQDWQNDFRMLIDRDGHARQIVVRGGTLTSAISQSAESPHAAIGITLSAENSVRGVLVSEIYPGSPADQAGLRSGDLVMAVNGMRVTSPEELRAVILQHRPGDELDLSVNREGWRRNFLLISMNQGDLSRLPAPKIEPPTATVPPTTVPGQPAAFQAGPVQPFPTDSAPRDSWGDVYDVNRRALYTDFD